MNCSERTLIVAEGIHLQAALQDLPGNRVEGSEELKAWMDYSHRYPWAVDFVGHEQFALFDRVNAKSWRY